MPRGIDCKLYRNSAALGAGYATPTWNEVTNVRDVQLNHSLESFEMSTRHELGVKVYEQTMSEIEVTGMLRHPEHAATTGDPGYDDFIVFRDAYFGNTVLHLQVLNGGNTTNGVIGLNGFFKIAQWNEDQSNGVGLMIAFTLKPCPVDVVTLAATATAQAMRRVKVASGAATYANFGSTSFS